MKRDDQPKPIQHIFASHVESEDGLELVIHGTLECGDGVYAGIKLDLVGIVPEEIPPESAAERIVPRAEQLPSEPFDPLNFD